MPQKPPILRVMVSSTARDLASHRKEAMDACLRVDCFPMMMEHLFPGRAPGLARSLEMVDDCDIYVLIVGVRYGKVPNGSDISITEAEYEHALTRDIPLLVFIALPEHEPPLDFAETGDAARQLERFRHELEDEHVVNYFQSVTEFRGLLVNALAHHAFASRPVPSGSFHHVVEIPRPRAPYIAHRYTLIDSAQVVGRQRELELLSRWIDGQDADLREVRIMVITALGGMGKSALTWKWFSELSTDDSNRFAGRIWWSFYESDATYENFTARVLAYVTGMTAEDALRIPIARRESKLLAILKKERYLICLDGLERTMVAYAHLDAAATDEEGVEKEAGSATTHRARLLRKTADWRVGVFLQKLSDQSASRVLTTSRLYPSDLEDEDSVRPGCLRIELGGLDDQAGVALWRSLGIRGHDEELLTAIRAVQQYPLLMRVLAGEIMRFGPAPGDYAAWHAQHPLLDPFSLPLVQVRSEVLQRALEALSPRARVVLVTMAAFRRPVSYNILRPLFVGGGSPFVHDSELHEALSELEGRGLMGWDRVANRYDLHPLVRRIVMNTVHPAALEIVYENVHEHLAGSPAVTHVEGTSIDDLAPAIEFYYTLLALGRDAEAYRFFRTSMLELLVYRLSRFRVTVEMLEPLFPNGVEHEPRLSDPEDAISATWTLAISYDYLGEVSRGLAVWPRLAETHNHFPALNNYSTSLVAIGRLREAEKAMQECVNSAMHPTSRNYVVYRSHLGFGASLRGDVRTADRYLQDALSGFPYITLTQPSDLSPLLQSAMHALRNGRLAEATELARRAQNAAAFVGITQMKLDAIEMKARVLIAHERHDEAEALLTEGLAIAGEIGNESEVSMRIALADIYRRRNWLELAKALLDEVWEPLRRGPLRIWSADAHVVLAEAEWAAGHRAASIEAANEAYRLAWCDGPPYAYAHALEKARALLRIWKSAPPIIPVENRK
jgi:tetratricopeptide (TPR) repeat protein